VYIPLYINTLVYALALSMLF